VYDSYDLYAEYLFVDYLFVDFREGGNIVMYGYRAIGIFDRNPVLIDFSTAPSTRPHKIQPLNLEMLPSSSSRHLTCVLFVENVSRSMKAEEGLLK
jgi:hypothetical protein